MELPRELVKHVTEGLGETGKRWVQSIPELISRLEALWRVRVGVPLEAGEFNFVAPAARADEDFIIKIAPP